ncbi:hypothetical protein FQR65_LT08210 [Abscondita terminalis]|nr:hypothetical protein FQR65_LT08210 [Abscondita terminalis]
MTITHSVHRYERTCERFRLDFIRSWRIGKISISYNIFYFNLRGNYILSSIVYVFETKYVNHRCKIVGCDVESTEYLPVWWANAIPTDDGKPSKCLKFQRFNESNTQSCETSSFNQDKTESCEEFIYETKELSILQDYNLQCDENVWKLTIVGTIRFVAIGIGMPIFGMLSDRFGRKTVLIYGLTLTGLIGIGRSFANSYGLFLALVCLDAICRSGSYPTVWILGLELVQPKKRVLVSFLISVSYASAGILQGSIAWIFQSWRVLLQITYATNLIMVFYYWLIPESVTWLLAKKKFKEVKIILKTLSKVNGRTIPENILEDLDNLEIDKKEIKTNTTSELLRSKILMARLANSAICWICCLFLYNGLTINSVELSQNSYLDYILTMAAEIPGCIAYIVTDYVGRRVPLAGGCLLSGLSCICLIFVPTDLYWATICIYMLAKFGITVSNSVIYTITTELYPTPFRNAFLTICSMIGGIGAMAAPQMPLAETLWKPLPMVMFGVCGILAAFLALLFPETMNTKLPNTIEEAENIGKTTTCNT